MVERSYEHTHTHTHTNYIIKYILCIRIILFFLQFDFLTHMLLHFSQQLSYFSMTLGFCVFMRVFLSLQSSWVCARDNNMRTVFPSLTASYTYPILFGVLTNSAPKLYLLSDKNVFSKLCRPYKEAYNITFQPSLSNIERFAP